MIIKHFRDISVLVLKEVVSYAIPLGMEAKSLDISKYSISVRGDELILEIAVKENSNSMLEQDAPQRREVIR
jgi:hypothetical protein